MKLLNKRIFSKIYTIVGVNKRKIKGKSNSINCKNAYLKNVYISIKGNNNIINIHENVNLNRVKISITGDNNIIDIGENCNLINCDFVAKYNNCSIKIGSKSTAGNPDPKVGRTIFAAVEENSHIMIGKDCMLAHDIDLRTGDGHPIYDLNHKRINEGKDIIISDHVWIGAYARILKGSFINNNSIVSLGAIVTKEFHEENCIIAGVPAKIVKHDVMWERD